MVKCSGEKSVGGRDTKSLYKDCTRNLTKPNFGHSHLMSDAFIWGYEFREIMDLSIYMELDPTERS